MVRSIQEMTEQNAEHITDVMEDIGNTIKMCIEVYTHLQALEERGVKWIDAESYDPVVPDNVLMFPRHKRVQ